MTTTRCKSCAHFAPESPFEALNPYAVDGGQCRISPPVLLVVQGEPVTAWPIVRYTDFCGAWQEAPAPR
jgi:hypothetical protein